MENFYDNEDSRIQQIFKIILASVVLRTLLLRDDEKTVEIMNVIWTDVNGDNDDTLRDRNDIRDVLKGYLNVQHLILLITIYMKKFLQSDWLRAVQFLLKQCRKELIQCKKRKKTKHSDWSMIKETHRWPMKSFAFKSSARPRWRNGWRTFSWLRDTPALSRKIFIYIIYEWWHDFSCAIRNK